ncbi:MAG: hypothetical protein HOV81_22710 [Kofleriaceae bacterium]|nr:hypothetical protein [Kofleriaceae bacterium]
MRHLGLYLVLAACANNVPQDRSTGPDGKQRGAKQIALEDGAGRARGIVTYPGGDRVDWKKIVLPEGKRGDLDLKLTWQAPRPGLQVAFDVFDQWNTPIAAPKGVRKGARTRVATIFDAKGTYWVRVFAPKRGDAGAYKLEASFTQPLDVPPPDLTVPDPPRLAAVPAPEATCDVFDAKNDACKSQCDAMAPKDWPGCAQQRKDEEAAAARAQAMTDYKELVKNWPKAVTVKILGLAVEGDSVRVTLGIGTTSVPGLDSKWTGAVLGAQTGNPLAGGNVTILSVGKTQVQAKVRLTVDTLNANRDVKLSPPPPPPPPL